MRDASICMALRARNTRRFSRASLVAALVAALATAGCIERRMTIRSNPPGAAVYVDDYQIGTTPVAVNYTYYGTRKIRLVKDGYETVTVFQPMPTPWYDWFGIDFFSENVWPGKIRDERGYEYQMQPMVIASSDQLLERAQQLRASGQSIVPASATQPVVVGPPVAAPAAETLSPATIVPQNTLPAPTIPQNMPIPQSTLPAPAIQPNVSPAPQVTYPQPSTISPPITSGPTYAPPGSAVPNYVPPGTTAPYSSAPAPSAPYLPPSNSGPAFSSPGGFGVGGASPATAPSAAPMPLFPESGPAGSPIYSPPPSAAPALLQARPPHRRRIRFRPVGGRWDNCHNRPTLRSRARKSG